MASVRCPRCTRPCRTRLRYLTGVSGGVGIGLVFILALPFLRPVYCPDHGKIPLAEFPEEDQKRMRRRVAVQFIATVVILVVAVALIAYWVQA